MVQVLVLGFLCRCPDGDRAAQRGESRRRHLLQLPAAMGRLRHHAQGRSRPISATTFLSTTRIPARRCRRSLAEKANPVADVVYYGVNFGMKAKAAGDLIEPYKPKLSEAGPGRTEGSRRLLDDHPFRHARPLRQQRRARRRAGAGVLEGSAEAANIKAWSAISIRPPPRSALSARSRSTLRSAAATMT